MKNISTHIKFCLMGPVIVKPYYLWFNVIPQYKLNEEIRVPLKF